MFGKFKSVKKSSETAKAEVETQKRFLTQPLLLEEGRAPRVFASLLGLTCAFVCVMIVWASITKIKELTIASGQIKPVGSLQVVQHLEGGMVLELLVSEGQAVEKGAPLVRMQPTAATSDFEQLSVRLANFALQRERLSALIQTRKPNFGKIGKKYPELVREQLQVMQQNKKQSTKEREAFTARLKQRDTDIETFTKQSQSLSRQVKIQTEQLKIRRNLLKEGLVSKAAFLEAQRIYEKIHGELLAMRGQLKKALEVLNEARAALQEFDANVKKKMVDEHAKIVGEIAELKQNLAKHKDRVTRLLVRAPIRGIVQELSPKAIGEVIKPGEIIAKIVPLDQELVAEVQIAPDDIGHIKVGHKAEVKVTTFDAARLGGVKGLVAKLSATTFQTEKGEPYYKAIIALERNYVGDAARRYPILPGMVVNAEIITGSKSLTRYLLKPVYRSLNIAFSER